MSTGPIRFGSSPNWDHVGRPRAGRNLPAVTTRRGALRPELLGNLDLNVRSARGAVDGLDDLRERALNSGPTGGLQHDDADSPSREALLIFEIGIGRDDQIETRSLGGIDQFAVLEPRPSIFVSGLDTVFTEEFT